MIGKALLALIAFAFSILLARWFEEGDYYDPYRGRRHCGAAPSAIKDWSYTSRTPRPADVANLNRWLDDHPDQANRLFGAFCWTPLHSAARFGREDLAELLVARGADVRTPDEPGGSTALHLAAQYGQVGVAKVLVARGADVNARTKFGKTPLHDAVDGLGGTSDLEGRVSVVQLLLAHGADVNARENGSNRTPLDHAAAASANQANSERMTQLLLAAGANPRSADSQGESPLHQAAVHGNLTAVRRLLDGGADANAAGRDTTPLGTAASRGHVEVVALLLSRGADASRSVPGSRLEGDGAPLAMAFLQGRDDETRDRETRRLEVARLLLDRGARIDARDQRGSTVLHRVALQGNLAAVELLVSRRASIDLVDLAGLTPLHLAVREGHLSVATKLLEHGANPGVRAGNGMTVLDFAGNDRDMDALVRRYAKH